MGLVGGAAICRLGPEPGKHQEGFCIPAVHSPWQKALSVRGISGRVICTQWEAEISFSREISE